MTLITVPDFISAFPFPTHLNPYYFDASVGTREWFASYGVFKQKHVLETFEQGNWTYLAAISVPDAPSNRLRLISDYLCWLFLFDDMADVRLEPLSIHNSPLT